MSGSTTSGRSTAMWRNSAVAVRRIATQAQCQFRRGPGLLKKIRMLGKAHQIRAQARCWFLNGVGASALKRGPENVRFVVGPHGCARPAERKFCPPCFDRIDRSRIGNDYANAACTGTSGSSVSGISRLRRCARMLSKSVMAHPSDLPVMGHHCRPGTQPMRLSDPR